MRRPLLLALVLAAALGPMAAGATAAPNLAGHWLVVEKPLTYRNDPTFREPWTLYPFCASHACGFGAYEFPPRRPSRHWRFHLHADGTYHSAYAPRQPTGDCLNGHGMLVAAKVYRERRTITLRASSARRFTASETVTSTPTSKGLAKNCRRSVARYRLTGTRQS
jgi:hypothetical protein